MRYHSCSTSSEGASPLSSRQRESSSSVSRSCFSCCSFMAVAWYMESSDTTAIMRRVVSLMRAWNSLTRFARVSVSVRPSAACVRSRSDSAVTSSSTNSFSSSCSFLSFNRSSSTCALALSCSSSGSSPSSGRQRASFSGVSKSWQSLAVTSRSAASWCCNSKICSAYSGILGICLRVTAISRSSSADWMRSMRTSWSFSRNFTSPSRNVASWMLLFS
mmetsp:Transcript_18488/g.43509  ORF Transcript_18488/g.43509 Transcript_18488/m.43509 type:complete len:218 (+) Transcript_18488:196-849(+)